MTIGVRDDLRNDVFPCRVLEISVNGYMDKSLGCELIPACPDTGALRGIHSTVARIPADKIDPQIIRKWIETCQTCHGSKCCTSMSREFDFALWVIDVEEMKLCKLPRDAGYLALSYVWGTATAFLTTKGNLDTRSSRGGLQHVIQISSRAVQDAVKLTRDMGQQYIWIDQLCVIRGDDGLLNQTLRAMGAIYHHATATIVAAGGSDANAGLPGVQSGSRDLDHLTVFIGSGRRRFALIRRPRTIYLDGTTYLKRAWTYQEFFFGMRRIIFRDGRVNFKCPVAHWQEELDLRYLRWPTGLDHGIDTTSVTGSVTWGVERFSPDNVASTRKLGGDMCARMLEFMITEFTERELTRDGDILNAFAGVGSYLSDWIESPLRLGLSEKHFFGCLIWKMRGEYNGGKPFASKKRPGFPTWTWASRYGTVHCSGNFYESCFDGGRNICLVDNWAPVFVWMDFYLSNAEGRFRRLECLETQNRHIDLPRFLRGESAEPVSAFLVESSGAADINLPLKIENTLFFRTVTITRSIKGRGRYFTFWACGMPQSIWNDEGEEIGCMYVDDIDYATWEGEAELLLISMVEGIPPPWENRRVDELGSLGFGFEANRQKQKDTNKGNERYVGYFNVMWVISDASSSDVKNRVGTGIILSQFLIRKAEEKSRSGMVDVYLS
ncbi:Fc.00g095540.m01.CDS01 [Cosmosporella sp. VM-42]